MMERNAQWQNGFSAARSLHFGGEYGAEFGEERRGVHGGGRGGDGVLLLL
jgi:hypothetical protein